MTERLFGFESTYSINLVSSEFYFKKELCFKIGLQMKFKHILFRRRIFRLVIFLTAQVIQEDTNSTNIIFFITIKRSVTVDIF